MENLKLNLSLFNAFNDVVFVEDSHTYSANGRSGISVTGVKKEYTNKFDEQYWSKYTALKRTGYRLHPGEKGKTIMLMHTTEIDADDYRNYTDVDHEDIIKEWREKGRTSREQGHLLHKYLEDGVWNKRTMPINKTLDEFLRYYKARFIPIVTEFVVANPERTIFGQLDNLSYDTITNTYCIIDYKTDEQIKTENKYETMLAPLDELDDCSFNEYMIQLNLYRTFLLPYVNVETLFIGHIGEEVTLIDVPLYDIDNLIHDYHRKRTILA